MQRPRRFLIIGGAVAALAAAGAGTAIAVDDSGDRHATGGGADRARSAALAAGAAERAQSAPPGPVFSDPTTIDNRYLPLTAHHRCELRGGGERVIRKVLERTKRFDIAGQRVDAVVIRDKSYEDGKLAERTLDYFAQSDDGTVYYLGEDVDNIKRGKVVNHHGSWLYGRDTDVPGVAMPPRPQVGDQWRFEDVPAITTESDRVEETGMRSLVDGRMFHDVIRVQEFVQPEGEVEYKLYAPGVGLIVEYPPDARIALRGCR